MLINHPTDPDKLIFKRNKYNLHGWNDIVPPLNLFNWPKSMTIMYKNKREEILTEAMSIVSGARADAYGGPEDSFSTIADLWAAYCGRLFTIDEVAIMLALLKIARLKKSPTHKDSWVDLAGYAACGAECALK